MKAEKRKRVAVSTRVAKLSVAVVLKDETTPDKRPEGEVFLAADGVQREAAPGGIYPLVGASKRVEVRVGGKLYQEETVQLDLATLDQQRPFKEVALKRLHPNQPQILPQPVLPVQPMQDSALKGRVVDAVSGGGLAGARIGVRNMTEKAVTGSDGAFSLSFMGMAADKKVTLYVSKEGYKQKEATVLVRSEITTVVPDLKLAAV